MPRAGSHVAPDHPDGWVDLAQRELSNVAGAYKGGLSNDAKINHALFAVECSLKACLWKIKKWPSWPRRQKELRWLYAHDLNTMLKECGFLEHALRSNIEREASWEVLVNAVEKQFRYSTQPVSDIETNNIVRSARHLQTGVVPWLLARYRLMT